MSYLLWVFTGFFFSLSISELHLKFIRVTLILQKGSSPIYVRVGQLVFCNILTYISSAFNHLLLLDNWESYIQMLLVQLLMDEYIIILFQVNYA